MRMIDLGGVHAGDGHPCAVIAELGINHGGSTVTAEKLIDAAAFCGAQAVKLQKRTVSTVFTPEELARPRESPFGSTNGDLKRGLELSTQAYRDLARYARAKGLQFTASCWDLQALDDVLGACEPPWLKIASAVLTWPVEIRRPLLKAHGRAGLPIVMSTGMCSMEEIAVAIDDVQDGGIVPIALLACTSTYPCNDDEINLRTIATLREEFGFVTGFSGHERGIATTVAAATLGAAIVERHITLDRASYGSDQSASLEPPGFAKMVRDIRTVERAMGSAEKRCLPSEEPVRAKLRRAV